MSREGRQPRRSWVRTAITAIAVSGLAAGVVSASAAARSVTPGASHRFGPAVTVPATQAATHGSAAGSGTIRLRSRQLTPDPDDRSWVADLGRLQRSGGERVHLLVQLGSIPDAAAKLALEGHGLSLLAYVPERAWIASFPADEPERIASLPGVVWAGELTVDDKLDPAIRADRWGPWNLAPDGTAAVFVALHRDESLDTGRNLVAAGGGRVTGQVVGINLLTVELPRDRIPELAADDSVQWIEPAAPPLGPVNDGNRTFIHVNDLQAAPYGLDGTAIDVLVYDSGQAGDHVDFGSRLVHGDADTVSEHSTHVAGTVGGSGANSTAQGGTALEWRGMAPAADLISFGTGYSGSGVIFYENVPDIEADFAAAQNTYGADLANASLGSNIYDNYPTRCDLMGAYGAASVLLDQIVRGGNTAVGVGDPYITAWAAGNERGWGTSCGTYGTVAPPASAKNPIHVGGANTNDSTMYVHGSWGPTGDGRIKPTVVAGACQTSGDFGVTSTDNNPVDTYTVMCGTSMATPAVTGGLALLLEHYRDEYGTSGNFWPSTAKTILIQTAVDTGNPGPDYQWGFGTVDMRAAAELITRRAFRQESVAAAEIDEFSFEVASAAQDVMVSLAWDDYEATFNADPTLINDLDLELVAPDGNTWRPWILDPANPADPATRGVNTVDNQEQVVVPAASVVTGRWLARVAATTVPQSPQSYSLACEGCVVGQHASLSVATGPPGTGTVNGTGIACGSDCWEVYALNATTVLTASPEPGYALVSWTGCDSPSGATCTMTMDADKSVTATFQPVATLDVAIDPVGGGAVSGAGIACPGDCGETYPLNTVVTLDAVANPGFVFASWTGCDSPSGTSCTMTMDADKSVTAVFQPVVTLDVVVIPPAGGHVTGSGIDCPGDCTEVFNLGEVVDLTAASSPTTNFVQWIGCDSVSGPVCTVVMDGDTTVSAEFATKVPTSTPLGLAILIAALAVTGVAILRRCT